MHVFTSISANYLPKARVLATTLKRFHPDAVFHLLLADSLSGIPVDDLRVFDNILTLNELPSLNQPAWIFQHGVAELCAAIKGVAAQELLRHCHDEHLYFFDPDIAILGPLDVLEAHLSRHSVIVTPHICVPEETPENVLANEICALRHGVFNLGFLGLRPCAEGRQFADWWAQRLWQLCYDDMPGGVFGDQRWVDLAPVFFPGLGIVRDPECNVATWNLTSRKATGSAPFDILVNGRPLCFYHFSGIDNGAQEQMLNYYGTESEVLFDLRRWYLAECERLGQAQHGKRPWLYGFYDNGTPITREQRLLYRARPDLQAAFPDPFAVGDADHSYLYWYENSVTIPAPRFQESERVTREARFQAQETLLAEQATQLQARESERSQLLEMLATKDAGIGCEASFSKRVAEAIDQHETEAANGARLSTSAARSLGGQRDRSSRLTRRAGQTSDSVDCAERTVGGLEPLIQGRSAESVGDQGIQYRRTERRASASGRGLEEEGDGADRHARLSKLALCQDAERHLEALALFARSRSDWRKTWEIAGDRERAIFEHAIE